MLARRLLRTAAAAALTLAAALVPADGAGAAGAAPRWEVSFPGDSPGSLLSVSAVHDDLAWAVGRKAQHGVIMRWDGKKWREDAAPGLPRVQEWSSVSAVSADDVWAYGLAGRGQALVHYDGKRWTRVPTTGPFDDSWPEVSIKAVPGRLFKGGKSLYTYAKGTWKTFALPHLVDIRDIDALAADDAYATGMQYPVDGGHPVIYHWDGTTWTLMETPPVRTGTDTAKITVASRGSVYVAGWAQGSHGGPPVPSVVHWNGSAWKDVTGSLADLWLTEIESDGHGGLWVTGTDRTEPVTAAPVFWHYDGTGWTKMPGALAPDGDHESPRYAFYDMEPSGSSGAYWAVGDYSMPMTKESDTPINGLIERSTPHPPAATHK
ncbi:hypothetical protein SAMN06272775_3197 [Streptomyces sp. 2323.1]|uniref:hypothetical protein n=1 Tax=Streptomyces sp. 2323.1 TaxID=1938841 RepID=UPI000BB93677|nr:hypothetical protein [Streptomyces sp. 2323.1]SOE12201.1 hypothetical protein SAMN06272775_3197 [Streptomyces sp. 2323.1]